MLTYRLISAPALACAIWFAVLVCSSSPAIGLTPVTLSAQRFGDTTQQICQAATTDGAGNVFLTGYFVGTLNFGGSDLVSPISYDIFLVKFNAAGAHQWSKSFGVTSHQYAYSVATDPAGNVYVAGYFEGTVDFGGGNLVSAGNADIFLAKFSPDGVHQWSKRFGDTVGEYCYDVATDPSGNVYLPCIFTGSIDLGGGALTTAGSADIALAKFDGTGAHLWSQSFGDSNPQYAYSVAAAPTGDVYLGGWFAGTVNFGGAVLTSSGGFDVCLAKFDASGVHQWSKRFGSPDSQYLQCVETDAFSNVYITGRYLGGINFGLGPNPSAGGEDVYLAMFDAAGVPRWGRGYGDAALEQRGHALATDAAGNVYLAGHAQGTVNFGGNDLTSAGDHDAFLAKFNNDGVHQWSRIFGDASDQRAYTVAVDSGSNAWLAGYISGSADFGSGTLTSAGIEDVFLAEFSAVVEEPVITSITDIGNDQGRQVLIEFARSFYDDPASSSPIVQYEAYRRNDAALPTGWTQVGQVTAHSEPRYSIAVPTIRDSTVTHGQYYSTFFIHAAAEIPGVFYDSPPDSGYSLDNLAPDAPEGLVCNTNVLSWNSSSAADFDHFSVYGSNVDLFASAALVDQCLDPTMDVSAAGYVFYYVTATDSSGNEGPPAVINTLSDAGGTPQRYALSITARPNPFNPSTTMHYTIPSPGHVRITIHDVRGTLVATLVDGDRDAGAFAQRWDGNNTVGQRVGSGVYFARVQHDTGSRSYKLVMLK